MKVIILRENLKIALSSLEKIVVDNNNLPVLKNILINADTMLILSATNLEIGVVYSTPAKINEKGSITVPLSTLNSIINNTQSDRISLEVKENTLIISTDNYSANISGISADEFPIIPKIEDESNSFVVKSEVLKEAVNSIVGATQTSNLKPELYSILFDFQIGNIKLVATDGFRLGEKTLLSNDFSTNFKTGMQAIIPLKTIQEITRIFPDDIELNIYFDSHQVGVKAGGIFLISRLIDAQYPDYTQIIPKNTDYQITVDKKEIQSAIKLVSSFASRTGEIRFKIAENGKSCEIYATDQSLGENTYIVPVKRYKGEGSLEISFNWRYLLDGIKPISADVISLAFNGSVKPATIKPLDDESLFYIVMPIQN